MLIKQCITLFFTIMAYQTLFANNLEVCHNGEKWSYALLIEGTGGVETSGMYEKKFTPTDDLREETKPPVGL